jgi:hypothetical protein
MFKFLLSVFISDSDSDSNAPPIYLNFDDLEE